LGGAQQPLRLEAERLQTVRVTRGLDRRPHELTDVPVDQQQVTPQIAPVFTVDRRMNMRERALGAGVVPEVLGPHIKRRQAGKYGPGLGPDQGERRQPGRRLRDVHAARGAVEDADERVDRLLFLPGPGFRGTPPRTCPPPRHADRYASTDVPLMSSFPSQLTSWRPTDRLTSLA